MKHTIIKSVSVSLVVIAVLIALFWFFGGDSVRLQGTTNLDSLELSGNLSVAGNTTLTSSSTVPVMGYSGVTTISQASSATTTTLTQAQIADATVVLYTGSSTAANRLTLPASSTLAAVVPTTGSSRFLSIDVTGTTTLAGNTGVTIRNNSVATTTIATSGTFHLFLYRLSTTNIIASLFSITQ